MRTLLCVDGHGTAELLQRTRALLDLRSTELVGLYVLDVGPRGALEFARRGFIGAERLPPRHADDVAAAERTRAEAVLGELAGLLAGSGLRADLMSAEGVPE